MFAERDHRLQHKEHQERVDAVINLSGLQRQRRGGSDRKSMGALATIDSESKLPRLLRRTVEIKSRSDDVADRELTVEGNVVHLEDHVTGQQARCGSRRIGFEGKYPLPFF